MNKAELREKDIMTLLRVSGKVSVAEAMALLDVSESTVRRLFNKLADSLACALVIRLKSAAVYTESRHSCGKLHLGSKAVKVCADGKGYGRADYSHKLGRLIAALGFYCSKQTAVIAGNGLQLSKA